MLSKSQILALFPKDGHYFVDGVEPILLSEVKENRYTLLENDKEGYQVDFAPEIFETGILKITFGYKKNHTGFTLDDRSMFDVKEKTFGFKHYRRSGSKFWTYHDGMEFTLHIPISKITLVPIKGMSYVPMVINGVALTLNVSGGTSNGWTDWVSGNPHSSINVPIRKMKKIMEVALPNPEFTVKPPKSNPALEYIFAESEEENTEDSQRITKRVKLKFIGSGTKSWCQKVIKQHYQGKQMYICRNTLKGRYILKENIKKKFWKQMVPGKSYLVGVEEVLHFGK